MWAIKIKKSKRWLRSPIDGERLEWQEPPRLGHPSATFDLAFVLPPFGLTPQDVEVLEVKR